MAHCRACDALAGMIEIYRGLDSVDAAERLSRTWIHWLPRSPSAWAAYSLVLGQSDQFSAAHAAIDSANKYSGVSDPLSHAV